MTTRAIDPRFLPWSAEAEQSVLGCVLNAGLDAAHELLGLGLQSSDFFGQAHRAIWSAMVEMAGRRADIDLVTVFQHLHDRGQGEAIGGMQYLNALAASVPSARNLQAYMKAVREKALLRGILRAADEAQDIAVAPDGSAAEKLDKVAGLFASLSQRDQASEPRALGELLTARMDHWVGLAEGRTSPGFRTGLHTLDAALGGGLKPGKLIILAARPSVGKTSLAGQIALSVAAAGAPVLVLSQEMPAGELVDRAVANLVGVGLGELSSGGLTDADWPRLVEASQQAAGMPLHIDDDPGLNLYRIRAKAQAMKRRHGLALLVVDYLQLCAGTNGRDNRNQQIEEISRGLKTLAKELGVTVLALSQLSRKAADRSEPDLTDLRDSGAIEQDADTVALLHPRESIGSGSMVVACILAKNRQGRRGRLALEFHGPTQRWSESSADVSRR